MSKVGEPKADVGEDKDCSKDDCQGGTEPCKQQANSHRDNLAVPYRLPPQPYACDEEYGPDERCHEEGVVLKVEENVRLCPTRHEQKCSVDNGGDELRQNRAGDRSR